MKPIRMKRFNQRAKLISPNGLPVALVANPSKFGNPYSVKEYGRSEAIRLFTEWIKDKDVSELKGKNLACYCDLDQACHADILLKLANE